MNSADECAMFYPDTYNVKSAGIRYFVQLIGTRGAIIYPLFLHELDYYYYNCCAVG